MSTNPIDVIARAIRVADGSNTMGAGRLAEAVAEALDHPDIVSNAAEALLASPYGRELYSPVDDVLEQVAAIVLRSVGGRNG